MRPTTDQPRRRASPRRRRLWLVGLAVALVVLLTSLRGIAGFYTDYLWFDALGLDSVWFGLLQARVGLVVAFGLAFFVLLLGNLLVAERLAPRQRPAGPEEEMVERYHELIGNRGGVVRVVVSAVLAMFVGVGVVGQWNNWILFRNGGDFGVTDAQFGRDVGFYVFQLPFLRFVTDWLFASVIFIALLVAAAHYLNGGIRVQTPGQRVSAAVKAHLSVLFAVLALLRSFRYYLDRFELTLSSRGFVDGAGYTDVKAQLPATTLLILVSLLAAVLLLVNIRQRRWTLPLTAVGLWAFVAVVAGGLYPAFIQRFQVEPEESTREAEYIRRNIEATRQAMNLDDVEVKEFPYAEDLTASDLARNEETIRNIRLWDPEILERTYQRLQEVRTFYRFNDVDVDRYDVGGRQTQIVLSSRELNPDGLPADSWENRHLAYTHGFGAVLSPANAVTRDGQPDFITRDVPPRGEIAIDQPRLYHGESLPGYAIVNTDRREIDYPTEDGLETFSFEGEAGVGVGSVLRRAAFALRFGDVNPLISNYLTKDSRILYLRDIEDRVHEVAPFLRYDADPYPVVQNGRILWIVDAYTTTNRYPYAQTVDTRRQKNDSGLRHDFNYARNSVKAVVDAYDGKVTLYVVEDEPIVRAYRKAFPDLFSSDIPDELRAHFRYPEDLFRAQTDTWSRYHIEEPGPFYAQSDAWNVAQDPGTDSGGTATTQAVDPVTGAPTGPARERRMDPYYLLMSLPEEDHEQFLMLQPYVPFSVDDSRRELSAFMVAKSDPGSYGQLEVFVMPRGEPVDGPAIVNARIQQEPDISQIITLLSRAGSRVLQGDLVLIPIENSLLYVRPLYVEAEGTRVPELKQVVVAYGDRVVMRDTLRQALQALFGEAPDTQEEGLDPNEAPTAPPDPSTPDLSQVADLLAAAQRAFDAAEQALRDGDLAGYQRHVTEARDNVARARELSRTTAGAGQEGVETASLPARP
jgi:uncharacterized membrane protein (UPF0182 family)